MSLPNAFNEKAAMVKSTLLILTLSAIVTLPASAGKVPDTMWTYKRINGKELRMSVFLPDGYDAAKAFPVIAIFHGGSWNAGEPAWHYPDCAYWSSRGMIAASVEYRLKTRDGVEAPLECVRDAKSAIRFLRENAAKLKVDTTRVVAAGGSAGGQLAAALATLTNPDTNDKGDDLSISCKPDAVILYNPYMKCKAELSPPAHVVKGLPPFITFLGDQDQAITVAEIKSFHDTLKSAGNSSLLYIGKGAKHGFCNGRNPNNPFFYWSLELEDQFLVKHGILTGPSKVEIPDGVKRLMSGDFDACD